MAHLPLDDETFTGGSEGPKSGARTGWGIGELVDGRYEIMSTIGQGGMGVVHKVRHRDWGIDMAVKTPRKGLVNDSVLRERFIREARAWVDLGMHPNIVQCWFVREVDGQLRVFMDFVGGGSLGAWIKEGRIASGRWGLLLDLAIQAADGLAYAHERSLVHRDVKPANMLIHEDGRLCLTDFGLVKITSSDGLRTDTAEQAIRERRTAPGSVGPASLTLTSAALGTPEYGAPEQWAGAGAVDDRADIYALGVTLFELCCRRRPFDDGVHREPPHVLIGRHLSEPPPDPLQLAPDIPGALAKVILFCLAKAPEQRPASMEELRTQLAAIYEEVQGSPYPRQRPSSLELRADSLNNRAVSLWDLGEQEQAFSSWGEALEIDPHHMAATFNRELLGWRLGRRTDLDAKVMLEALAGAAPDRARQRYLEGALALERGDVDGAIQAFHLSLELEPESNQCWKALCEAHLCRADLPAAMDACHRAFELDREDLGVARLLKRLESAEPGEVVSGGTGWQEIAPHVALEGGQVLAFHADTGRVLLSRSREAESGGGEALQVQSLSSPGLIWSIDSSGVGYASRAAFDPAGSAMVVVCSDRVEVFSLDSREALKTIPLSDDLGLHITTGPPPVLCPDGTILVVKEWSMDEPAVVLACPPSDLDFHPLFLEPGSRIVGLEVNHERDMALTTSQSGQAQLWRLSSGLGQALQNEYGLEARFAGFSPDGTHLVTATKHGLTALLRLGEGWVEEKEWEISTAPDFTMAAALAPDNRRLATWGARWASDGKGTTGSQIRIWDLATNRCLRTLEDVPVNYLPRLAFSADGERLFSHSERGGLRVWRAPERRRRANLEICRPQRLVAAISASASAERAIREAEQALERGDRRGAYQVLRRAQQDHDYVFHPRVVELLRRLTDHGRRIGVKHQRCLHVMAAGHRQPVSAISFLSERVALGGTSTGGLQLWDLSQGECRRELEGHFDGLSEILVAASGEVVLTLDRRQHLRVWEAGGWTCRAYFDCSSDGEVFRALSLSDDGAMAFSVDEGGHAIFWDLDIEEMEDRFKLPLEAAPRGSLFAPGSSDIVHLELQDRSWITVRLADRGVVAGANLTRTRRPFTATPAQEDILILDTRSEGELTRLRGHEHAVSVAALSPGERYILSGDTGGMIRLWELDWELDFD